MGLFWGYQRTVHLILLLVILVLYAAYYSTNYIFLKGIYFDEYWYPVFALIFIGLLLLRGSSCCNCCFPFFHYTSLLLELLVQLASLVLQCFSLALVTKSTFKQTGANPTYDSVVYGLSVIIIAVYFLLVYKYVYGCYSQTIELNEYLEYI